MENLLVLIFSSCILLILIFNIRTSRRFNLFDHWLHHKLVKKRNGFKWQIIAFLNDPKLIVVWTVLLANNLIAQQKIVSALWVLGTLGFTDLIGILMKKLIKRKRPSICLEQKHDYSFPSGHVLSATTISLILVHLFGKQLGLGFILILSILWIMVVISRLSLKAHYPSDIIGATSLAVMCYSLAQQILTVI